jgi:phospholipase/carboxylesterase
MDEPIVIDTGPAPSSTVVVLHGLGADGNDFAPICEMLDLRAVGAVRFVLPHAPTRPVTANGGYVMRAWYDILAFGGGAGEDEAGLRQSRTALDQLIGQERSRGVASERIVVAGFSQGCAMALMVGLRHAERLAGIAGMSGYLPLAATTAAERSAANLDTPVWLAHGRRDPIVPIARGLATRDALQALRQTVEWHEYPIEHTVSIEEVADLQTWLVSRLG